MSMDFWTEWMAGSMAAAVWISSIACYVLLVVAWWKIFAKAGVEGWMAIIPFLNLYELYKISWGNGWLFLLSLIPFVGWIFDIIRNVKMSQAFGHGAGYAIGLIFLPNIFTLILGFGGDQYQGPAK